MLLVDITRHMQVSTLSPERGGMRSRRRSRAITNPCHLRRLIPPFLAWALLAAPGSGAQSFEDEASVLLVEVPVQVLVRSQPVRGLTVDRFELYDGGRRQEIVSFDVLDLDAKTDAARSQTGERVASTTARNLLLVMDLSYPGRPSVLGPGPITAAVAAAKKTSEGVVELLEGAFHPRDHLAVAYVSPLRGSKLLQGWTSDLDAVSKAFEILGAVSTIRPERVRELWQQRAPQATKAEAKRDRTHWATLEDLIADAKTASVRADPTLPHRDLADRLADDFVAMTRHLGDIGGARHLVFLSAGPPHLSVRSQRRLALELSRSGWAIQAINTAGLGWGSDSLFLLAHSTGGQLFTNSNDVAVLLRDMAEETAVTYVLSFYPAPVERADSFRRLRVKLVDPPKGVRLVHRPGYYPRLPQSRGER